MKIKVEIIETREVKVVDDYDINIGELIVANSDDYEFGDLTHRNCIELPTWAGKTIADVDDRIHAINKYGLRMHKDAYRYLLVDIEYTRRISQQTDDKLYNDAYYNKLYDDAMAYISNKFGYVF